MKKLVLSCVVALVFTFGYALDAKGAEVLSIFKSDDNTEDCTYNDVTSSERTSPEGVKIKSWDCYGKTGIKCCGDQTSSIGSNVSNTLYCNVLPASFTFEALDDANLQFDAGSTGGSVTTNFVFDEQTYTRFTEWTSHNGFETITVTIEEFVPGL